jgi:hypothetical protein
MKRGKGRKGRKGKKQRAKYFLPYALSPLFHPFLPFSAPSILSKE